MSNFVQVCLKGNVKRMVLTVVCSAVVLAGCAHTSKKQGFVMGIVSSPAPVTVPEWKPTPAKESFTIGAFRPSKTEYNFRHYDAAKTVAFLASIKDRFSDGELVAVDGLKWRLEDGRWVPFPNPPIPVFKQGDDRAEHCRRYAEWVNNHPHFGYPPIPMMDRK